MANLVALEELFGALAFAVNAFLSFCERLACEAFAPRCCARFARGCGEYSYEAMRVLLWTYPFDVDEEPELDPADSDRASMYQSTKAITFASRDGEYGPGR